MYAPEFKPLNSWTVGQVESSSEIFDLKNYFD